MLLQTFCYWGKQQSADSNIFQFHLTLKCTKYQSSHFCDCFLVSKWIFQNHDRGLTKFHARSEQLLLRYCWPTWQWQNFTSHLSCMLFSGTSGMYERTAWNRAMSRIRLASRGLATVQYAVLMQKRLVWNTNRAASSGQEMQKYLFVNFTHERPNDQPHFPRFHVLFHKRGCFTIWLVCPEPITAPLRLWRTHSRDRRFIDGSVVLVYKRPLSHLVTAFHSCCGQ